MRWLNCTVRVFSNRLRHARRVVEQARRVRHQTRRRSAARCCRSVRRAGPRPARRDRSAAAPAASSASAPARRRGGTAMARTPPSRSAVHSTATKITQARIRCVASRYCDTSTPLGEPRGDHPPADRTLQRAEREDPHSRPRRPARSSPSRRKNRNGSRNAAPITRPISRCAHSHQKMVLNSSQRHARCCAAEIAGWSCTCRTRPARRPRSAAAGCRSPVSTRRSTGPDSVSRVAPPTSTMAKIERGDGVEPEPDGALTGPMSFMSLAGKPRGPYRPTGEPVKAAIHAYPDAQAGRNRRAAAARHRMGAARDGVRAVRAASASGLVAALFYVVAGLGWVLPAMPLVAWMVRPDSGPDADASASAIEDRPVRCRTCLRPATRCAGVALQQATRYAASTRRNRFHSAVAAPEISTLA